MNYWRQILRFLVSLQLLPALEGGEETLVGGQVVMEGVMMRSPHAWGIAIRKPSGEITTHSEPLQRPSERRKWLGWPFIRGLATLGQAMRLGFVASKFSLNVGLQGIAEEEARQSAAKNVEQGSLAQSTPQEKPKSFEIGNAAVESELLDFIDAIGQPAVVAQRLLLLVPARLQLGARARGLGSGSFFLAGLLVFREQPVSTQWYGHIVTIANLDAKE